MSKDYSLSELLTGASWIDGKPIYRKVIQMAGSGDQPYQVDVSSLNIDTIVYVNALGHDRSTPSIRWCWSNTGNVWSRTITYNAINGTITLSSYNSYFPPDYLIIEYTKTEQQ